MDKDYFKNKIYCEFVMITSEINCHIVTKELNIEPHRYFNKGDKISSKFSNRQGHRPHGLWAIKSETIVSKEIDLEIHFNYFKKMLGNKINELEKLKNQYGFEYIFSISIETEDAGTGIDLSHYEISFINKIADRFSCSFISKNSIAL